MPYQTSLSYNITCTLGNIDRINSLVWLEIVMKVYHSFASFLNLRQNVFAFHNSWIDFLQKVPLSRHPSAHDKFNFRRYKVTYAIQQELFSVLQKLKFSTVALVVRLKADSGVLSRLKLPGKKETSSCSTWPGNHLTSKGRNRNANWLIVLNDRRDKTRSSFIHVHV